MKKENAVKIAVIAGLIVSIIALGIAFAAFSRQLTINGNAEIEASNWEIVFEGLTNASTLDDPTLTGSASVVTAPTIKNGATEIGNYEVSLRTPGDSVTYNFKIHNKGDYAASVSNIVMNQGVNLTTNTSKRTSEAATLNALEYRFYYTDNNQLVGSGDAKDCLDPGEEENVTLRIVFSSTSETSTDVLPSEELELDNLGITLNYVQRGNGSCTLELGEAVTNKSFQSIDGAYYTYEGKRFIGTGVNDVIVSENIISEAQFSSAGGTDNGEGANPRYTFNDSPAADAASAYCTGCRLMTKAEADLWTPMSKRIAKYNNSIKSWWLADANSVIDSWYVSTDGGISTLFSSVKSTLGVRPCVSVSGNATVTGRGTSEQPYVINQ